MYTRPRSFALLDAVALCVIVVLLIGLVVGGTTRAREMSRRSVCAMNLAGFGGSSRVYAMVNDERWPVTPFSQNAYNSGGPGIRYVNWDGTIGEGDENTGIGEVGWQRDQVGTSEVPGLGGSGSTAASVTRSLWLLVRSGSTSVRQFICPSSGDTPNDETNLERYYDFSGYAHISYGYLVPFGPLETRPRVGGDHRVVYAADKGPFYFPTWPAFDFQVSGQDGGPIGLDDPPGFWQPFNSANHGGAREGEGQNCLFADGHVVFAPTPTVGVDHDNIYTVMQDDWDATGFNLIHGETAHSAWETNPYPGVDALGSSYPRYASTDSFIYP